MFDIRLPVSRGWGGSQKSYYLTKFLLPSSVNVKLLVIGPNPAEVLALTETLYGMYLSATET